MEWCWNLAATRRANCIERFPCEQRQQQQASRHAQWKAGTFLGRSGSLRGSRVIDARTNANVIILGPRFPITLRCSHRSHHARDLESHDARQTIFSPFILDTNPLTIFTQPGTSHTLSSARIPQYALAWTPAFGRMSGREFSTLVMVWRQELHNMRERTERSHVGRPVRAGKRFALSRALVRCTQLR